MFRSAALVWLVVGLAAVDDDSTVLLTVLRKINMRSRDRFGGTTMRLALS